MNRRSAITCPTRSRLLDRINTPLLLQVPRSKCQEQVSVWSLPCRVYCYSLYHQGLLCPVNRFAPRSLLYSPYPTKLNFQACKTFCLRVTMSGYLIDVEVGVVRPFNSQMVLGAILEIVRYDLFVTTLPPIDSLSYSLQHFFWFWFHNIYFGFASCYVPSAFSLPVMSLLPFDLD